MLFWKRSRGMSVKATRLRGCRRHLNGVHRLQGTTLGDTFRVVAKPSTSRICRGRSRRSACRSSVAGRNHFLDISVTTLPSGRKQGRHRYQDNDYTKWRTTTSPRRHRHADAGLRSASGTTRGVRRGGTRKYFQFMAISSETPSDDLPPSRLAQAGVTGSTSRPRGRHVLRVGRTDQSQLTPEPLRMHVVQSQKRIRKDRASSTPSRSTVQVEVVPVEAHRQYKRKTSTSMATAATLQNRNLWFIGTSQRNHFVGKLSRTGRRRERAHSEITDVV